MSSHFLPSQRHQRHHQRHFLHHPTYFDLLIQFPHPTNKSQTFLKPSLLNGLKLLAAQYLAAKSSLLYLRPTSTNRSHLHNYCTTSSNVIEYPFNILEIESASRYYDLTFRQPVVQTPTQEFALGFTASRRESDISSLLQREGVPASELSPGADEQGRTRVSSLQFFQEWTSRNSREVIAARSQFNIGIGAFDATINIEPPDSRFFSWQGQAQWVRLLADETLLLVRANMQLADRSLLPIEQFGLGGLGSVRGYRQDLLLTDNGILATAEVQYPVLRIPQSQTLLQVVPFFDVGSGWNSGRENPDVNTLVSVGLGLQWRQGDRFTARLDWGIPLVSVNSRERTWQENGVYFSVIYNPF